MKSSLIVVLLLAGAHGSFAQSKAGTSVGAFLTIEPSARIAGMGNAGVTLYNELETAYYNPAAIGFHKGYGAQFTHSPWLADISYSYAIVAGSFGDFGNVYASVTALNSGEIDVRTVDKPLGTGERYTVSNVAFGVGYGRQVSERFSIGVQVNYISETIWHSSLTAFSFNVGTIYRIAEDAMHIGASLSNFGTRARYDGRDLRILYDSDPARFGDNSNLPGSLFTDNFPLPIVFRVGIGMPMTIGEDHRVTVAVDAFHPSDNTESLSLGAEWMFQNTLALRAGYQNLFLEDSELGLTLGAGVQYQMDGYTLSFDYGWADHGRLQKTHRLTVGALF